MVAAGLAIVLGGAGESHAASAVGSASASVGAGIGRGIGAAAIGRTGGPGASIGNTGALANSIGTTRTLGGSAGTAAPMRGGPVLGTGPSFGMTGLSVDGLNPDHRMNGAPR